MTATITRPRLQRLAGTARRPRTGLTTRWIDSALNSSGWVDAQPFRAHLHYLVTASGLHWLVVAHYCGIPTRTAERLMALSGDSPCRRISHYCAARLLAVRPAELAALRGATVDAGATHTRLQRLAHHGVPADLAADHVGLAPAELDLLLRHGFRTCSRLVALQVEAAWQHLVGDRLTGYEAASDTAPEPATVWPIRRHAVA